MKNNYEDMQEYELIDDHAEGHNEVEELKGSRSQDTKLKSVTEQVMRFNKILPLRRTQVHIWCRRGTWICDSCRVNIEHVITSVDMISKFAA